MSQTLLQPAPATSLGTLVVIPFPHPQGCRGYLLADPHSRQALALDVHLDLVEDFAARVGQEQFTLPYLVDSHTHADHPSGAAALAARFRSTRIAHPAAGHRGVTRHPADGERLHLGDVPIVVRHAPGHTPDHMVLLTRGALFSGDSLLIGSVARADFLGGDAGLLFDSLRALVDPLPDETVLYPGHDYEGRVRSTLGAERAANPWLALRERPAFVAALTANPPPRPANMDELLRWNREGVDFPARTPAATALAAVRAGGAGSLIDVRTPAEYAAEHVPGSVHVPLDTLAGRAARLAAVPAPRLLLCRSGARAAQAQEALAAQGLRGLSVVEGGLQAYVAAGGTTQRGQGVISLERQVRIAAGALVALFVSLGYLVHPALFGLAGLIGAGLVVAGITDFCGMGLLLARMPWNQRGAAGQAAQTAPGAAATACAASAPTAAARAAGAPPVAACASGAPPAATGAVGAAPISGGAVGAPPANAPSAARGAASSDPRGASR